jgi:hypothetical protein
MCRINQLAPWKTLVRSLSFLGESEIERANSRRRIYSKIENSLQKTNVYREKIPKIASRLREQTATASLKSASPEGNLFPHKRNILF